MTLELTAPTAVYRVLLALCDANGYVRDVIHDDLALHTGLNLTVVRAALVVLRHEGVVEQHGYSERRVPIYRVAAPPAAVPPPPKPALRVIRGGVAS
jgi:hypothetical protein